MCLHTSQYETSLSSGMRSPSATDNVAEARVLVEKGPVRDLEVVH